MNHRALHHALEPGRGLCVLAVVNDEGRKLVVDVVGHRAAKGVDIDIARPHDSNRILVFQQRKEQVLERRVFVIALIGESHRPMKAGLQGL